MKYTIPKLVTLLVTASAALLSLSISYAQPLADSTIPRTQRYFPWGGVDKHSYLYWPVTPPHSTPLKLIKAGKQAEAFNYCFSKIQTTNGSLRFFYTIQATTMGYGIWKSHLVAQLLFPEYSKTMREATAKGLSVSQLNPDLALEIAFAIELAFAIGMETPSDPRYRAAALERSYSTELMSSARLSYRERTYAKAEHQAVSAMISSFQLYQRPSALDQWRVLLQANPKNPEFNLVMAALSSTQVFGEDSNGKMVALHNEPGDPFAKYSGIAYALDANNVRALFQQAKVFEVQDPARAKELLTRYFDLGGGPISERALARSMLTKLNKK